MRTDDGQTKQTFHRKTERSTWAKVAIILWNPIIFFQLQHSVLFLKLMTVHTLPVVPRIFAFIFIYIRSQYIKRNADGYPCRIDFLQVPLLFKKLFPYMIKLVTFISLSKLPRLLKQAAAHSTQHVTAPTRHPLIFLLVLSNAHIR